MSDIRAAAPEDAGALTTMEQRASVAVLGHVFAPHPYPFADVLARWALVLADPAVSVLGAWEDELVGFVAFDRASLRHLGVAPERFGTGLADRLLAAAVDAWITAGSHRAELWVLADNRRARRFYERRGWTADGRTQDCPWPPHPTEVGYTWQG